MLMSEKLKGFITWFIYFFGSSLDKVQLWQVSSLRDKRKSFRKKGSGLFARTSTLSVISLLDMAKTFLVIKKYNGQSSTCFSSWPENYIWWFICSYAQIRKRFLVCDLHIADLLLVLNKRGRIFFED